MAEEDFSIDTPFEPQAITPKRSLIPEDAMLPHHTQTSFKDLKILQTINEGKFKVFLVKCQDHNQVYAMKVFSNDKQSEECYQNEIRFASLCHQNVIKTVYFEQNRMFKSKRISSPGSFILTEYCPYGDFLDFVDNYKDSFNDKLIRTYFRQLIQGLEYLQNRNIAHLDIKLENLLFDEDFQLKIADFDLSCFTMDSNVLTKGTKYYRAPEMIKGECKDGKAADIYSAGIVLFVLKSGGKVPHSEFSPYRGIDLKGLLETNNQEFWRVHCQIQNKKLSEFSASFRELFNGMLKEKPEERLTIREIKNSKWYNEPVYTNEEVKSYLSTVFGV